jgi:hypothetical protein
MAFLSEEKDDESFAPLAEEASVTFTAMMELVGGGGEKNYEVYDAIVPTSIASAIKGRFLEVWVTMSHKSL